MDVLATWENSYLFAEGLKHFQNLEQYCKKISLKASIYHEKYFPV